MSKDFDKDAPILVQRPPGGSEIIAIGGGKGGIGKSMLSANLGLALAERGARVVLFDADLGGANLHTCLGVDPPKVTLSEFMDKKRNSLDELVVKTPHANVSLVSGALDEVGAANPKYSQKLRLLKEIARFDADYVIIDLGAGTSYNTLDFFLIADFGVVSILPEPTSIENAYRFVKAAFFRRLKNLEHAYGLSKVVDRIMSEKDRFVVRTPADLIGHIVREAPQRGRELAADLQSFGFKLVVNQVRSAEDEVTAKNVRSACSKYFGVEIELFGALPYDNAVWQAVRKRQAVIKAFPDSEVVLALRKVAERVASTRSTRPSSMATLTAMEAEVQ
jgi:flagellar biosynthesis protein FlhG